MDGWIDGGIEGWRAGWMDGWMMDGNTHFVINLPTKLNLTFTIISLSRLWNGTVSFHGLYLCLIEFGFDKLYDTQMLHYKMPSQSSSKLLPSTTLSPAFFVSQLNSQRAGLVYGQAALCLPSLFNLIGIQPSCLQNEGFGKKSLRWFLL